LQLTTLEIALCKDTADYQEHIREILFQNYGIIYLHQDRQVYVLAVIDGSRDLQGMEHKPWAVG
jgi:hypothetical protein